MYTCTSIFVVGTLIFAAIFYMVSVAAVFMLFWNYTSWEGCLHNKIFIGVNTFLCIVLSGVTIVPAVTKCKPLCLLNWSIKSPIWWSMFPTCYKYFEISWTIIVYVYSVLYQYIHVFSMLQILHKSQSEIFLFALSLS